RPPTGFAPLSLHDALPILPLCLGGVILALLLTDQPISLPVAIGILMLMGIVTKNAIMLVDFAVEAQAKGVSRREAVIDAGRKRSDRKSTRLNSSHVKNSYA